MLKQTLSGCIVAIIVLFGTIRPAQAERVDKEQPSKAISLDPAQQRKFDYFFYEGLKLRNAGKFDAAYAAFEHCLTIDSTASPVLFELSNFYVQMNKPEKAVAMLRRAVANSPDNYTYRLSLASLSLNIGMYGEASDEYRELVKDHPEKPELNYFLAESLTQEGEIGDAIDAYNVLEDAIGMNEAISMRKFKLYNTLEKPEEAFKELDALVAKYPMEARYPILIGDLYLEKNDTVKALSYYKKAHQIDPENPYYTVSMSNYYEHIGNKEAAETQIRNALLNDKLDVETKVAILARYIQRLQQGKNGTESANTLFKTLLEQHPEETELKLMYASLLASQNKTDEALFQYQVVTEMEPENSAAWMQLLNLLMKADRMEEVLKVSEKCQELFPDAPEYYFFKGIAYFQMNKYQESLDTYYAGLKVIPVENKPLRSDFYGQIGDIYFQIKKPEEAFKAYDEALKLNENNVVVLNNYSYYLSLEKKELDKAERMSAQCIKLEPNNATYLDTYAWIFFVQGNYSFARIYIEKALSEDKTNSPELLDHYGDILFKIGEKEKAVEQWKKAKELGKKNALLDRKIAEENYIEQSDEKK